jgi:hypothetical protein
MLELFARPELRLYPMRLLSTAGPCLGSICWVLIFRKNLPIGTTPPIGPNRAVSVFKPAQHVVTFRNPCRVDKEDKAATLTCAVGSLGRLTSSADGVRICQLKVCFEIS